MKAFVLVFVLVFGALMAKAQVIADVLGTVQTKAASSYATPRTGTATIACGTQATISDGAGPYNYENNWSGYTVVGAGSTAVVRIYGPYNLETDYDYVYVYDGSGTGGTLLYSLTGSGNFDFTTNPGQTVTIQFVSDEGTVSTGFLFNIDYLKPCTLPNSATMSNNAVACGNGTVLLDPGGTGNYGNNLNSTTVLNASAGGRIQIIGPYNTESGYDHVKVFAGSSATGTALVDVTGSGTINYTGAVGQTLTVQFTSDGSVVGSGFTLNVYYISTQSVDGTLAANTASICLGQSVIITPSGGVGTPYYWCSNDGGANWNIFTQQSSNGANNSYTFTPTAPGTYRFHSRWYSGCGFCWDAGSGCTTYAYTDVVVTAPSVTGLASGDFVWSGNTNTAWSTNSNWLSYNGTNLAVSGSIPTSSNNVFVRSYGSCAGNTPSVIALSSCKNLTIESGKTLSLGSSQLDVYGSWVNNGTFNCGTGTINFAGSANQSVKAGGNPFYNVAINNSTAGNTDINITDPVVVNNNVTFTNGVIYFTASGSLTLGASSTANNGSATSFVDGPLSKIGTAAFIFPIGDAGVWAPIGIAAPAASSTITAAYNFTSPGNNWDPWYMCSNSIDHASGVEYWNLSSTNSKPAVTLYWKDGNRSGILNPSDLVVAHWTGTCWESMGAASLTGNASLGSLSSSLPFTSYSPITLGTKKNDNPLPISLLSFKGQCTNGKIVLNWITASEINNDYFTIEKSFDGLSWEFFQKVPGAGNSVELLSYSLSDEGNSDLTYYRLTQTDYNGSFEVFEPIVVKCENDLPISLSVYPNPVLAGLNIKTDVEDIKFEVFNSEGVTVLAGKGKFVDMMNLSSGLYLIKITVNGDAIYRKIIKQ